MREKVLCLLFSCAVLIASAASALAQTPSPMAEWQYSAGVLLRSTFEPKIPEWDVSVGIATELKPQYNGAKSYHLYPGPLFDVRYRDVAFASTGEGLGVNLLHGKTYRAGLALTYDLGRRDGENERLRRTGNLSPAPEAKLFGELLLMPVMLRADIRRGLGGYDGWVGDLGAYMPLSGSKSFFVMAGPSLTFADTTTIRHLFGISAVQSAQSGLPVFHTHGGAERAGFGVSAVWLVSDHWEATADASAQELLASAADSPLTERRLQLGLALGVAYHF